MAGVSNAFASLMPLLQGQSQQAQGMGDVPDIGSVLSAVANAPQSPITSNVSGLNTTPPPPPDPRQALLQAQQDVRNSPEYQGLSTRISDLQKRSDALNKPNAEKDYLPSILGGNVHKSVGGNILYGLGQALKFGTNPLGYITSGNPWQRAINLQHQNYQAQVPELNAELRNNTAEQNALIRSAAMSGIGMARDNTSAYRGGLGF